MHSLMAQVMSRECYVPDRYPAFHGALCHLPRFRRMLFRVEIRAGLHAATARMMPAGYGLQGSEVLCHDPALWPSVRVARDLPSTADDSCQVFSGAPSVDIAPSAHCLIIPWERLLRATGAAGYGSLAVG